MPRFLAEGYSTSPPDAEALTRLVGAKLIESLYVPEDELHLYVFESASADELRRAAIAASLVIDRIRNVAD
jgi:hypothetical protein